MLAVALAEEFLLGFFYASRPDRRLRRVLQSQSAGAAAAISAE